VLTAAVILISSCSDASSDEGDAWRTFENQQYGYSFNYPPDCTYGPLPIDCKGAPPEEQPAECLCFLNPENPDRVLMQKHQSDGDQLVLAEFSIAHLSTPADNIPDETGLMDWLAENFPDKWEHAQAENIKIDGIPAVSLSSPASEMAPAVKEIYFTHNDGLFQISMLEPDVAVNSILYERILTSFRFDR
jgi:hypothetical protein